MVSLLDLWSFYDGNIWTVGAIRPNFDPILIEFHISKNFSTFVLKRDDFRLYFFSLISVVVVFLPLF